MSIILHKNNNSFTYNFKKFLEDLSSAIKSWRIFILFGFMTIKKQYARSKLGQFWLTLPMAINIATVGIIWSYLFKIKIVDYLPYFAISIIFWNFIIGIINEGVNTFINYGSYISESNLPKTIYVFSLFIKNLIAFSHNLLILLPIYFFLKFNLLLVGILLSTLSVLLTLLFLFPLVLVLATFTLRFRDLPNIISSITQILFYVTPIMWKIDSMPDRIKKMIILNPINIFLSIFREPFFEYSNQYKLYWLLAILYTIISWLIGITIFCKYRKRIVYWL